MNGEVILNDSIREYGPPPLNYDLRARLCSNIIFWSSVVLTTTILPIVLYYPLVHLTNLPTAAVLSIVSAPNGLPNIYQIPFRIWKLWKQDGGDRRPLGGPIMDLFMWEHILIFIVIATLFTVATSIPVMRLYLMMPSTLVFVIIIQFIVSLTRIRIPFRLSSMPPNHEIRPAIYYMMEDIVAVDGGGRSAYRRALNERYEKSIVFQRLLRQMTAYWILGGLVFIAVSSAFTFGTDTNFAFGATLIWIPVWALIWIIPAFIWIQHQLIVEKQQFVQDVFTTL